MDPEIKKALEALRAELTKYEGMVGRIDAIEKDAKEGVKTNTALRTEIDALKTAAEDRTKTIQDLQRQGRVQRQDLDPAMAKRQAVELFGMIIRRELCRRAGQEVPTLFVGEKDVIARYEADVAARATLMFAATPGSYLVPTVLETAIIDSLAAVSPLVGNMDYVPNLPMGGTINIPVITGRPTLQPSRARTGAGSDTKMTQSDAAFARLSLTPQEAYIYFPVDNNFLMMSALPLGQILVNLLNQAIVQGIADWSLNGDGSASYNSIIGLLNETNGDYLSALPSGKTAFADLTKADMTAMKQKVLWQFWQMGRWLMNLDIEGVIEDQDRLGKVPMFNQDHTKILGNEYVLDALMPTKATSGAGKGFIGFGDLKTFLVGVAGGIRIASSTDYLFGNNQTAFRGTLLMDIQRKPVKSFVLCKTAAQ